MWPDCELHTQGSVPLSLHPRIFLLYSISTMCQAHLHRLARLYQNLVELEFWLFLLLLHRSKHASWGPLATTQKEYECLLPRSYNSFMSFKSKFKKHSHSLLIPIQDRLLDNWEGGYQGTVTSLSQPLASQEVWHHITHCSQVTVPMRFNGKSGVEVRLPTDPGDLKGYTSLSLFLQRPDSRENGGTEDMFVMYLGNKDVSIFWTFLSDVTQDV